MHVKKKIRVLIVDDSIMFREALSKGIALDPSIEVVATAVDPYDARDKLIEYQPDVMTLDVEMPKMNGIEFLKKLMPQYPIPVVVISAVSENVFDALDAGAVDFVTKPTFKNGNSIENIINELIVKVKIASAAKVGHFKQNTNIHKGNTVLHQKTNDVVIAIGASTGGTEAIYSLIKEFPRNAPGIVVVQHMPPIFTKLYADRLNNTCLMEVKEARNGDKILPGRVLIAPGNHHMKVKKVNNEYIVECREGEKINGHCPSVDVLFESVAKAIGSKAVGVILTGMGHDGAKGLLQMRKVGGRTIGQDEQSSIVYGMPKVAYDIGAVQKQASLESIPYAICQEIDSINSRR
jgi:two-component system chemotaxis response regulator CheB